MTWLAQSQHCCTEVVCRDSGEPEWCVLGTVEIAAITAPVTLVLGSTAQVVSAAILPGCQLEQRGP